jgi:hypothetical protein
VRAWLPKDLAKTLLLDVEDRRFVTVDYEPLGLDRPAYEGSEFD